MSTVNKFLSGFFYLPIALLATIQFIGINFFVFWPAYFKIVTSKFKLQNWKCADRGLKM